MVKKIIIANWKMSPQSHKMAEDIVKNILFGIKKIKSKPEIVLCPPYVWLTDFSHKIKQVKWGAQDVFWESSGAYTGEISAGMLKSSGVTHIIVGHSERRGSLGETDDMINKKIRAALRAGLKTVLCVGERSRSEPDFYNFIKDELFADLAGVSGRLAKNLLIAYEPLWAIGTGDTPEPDDIFEMATYIRRNIFDILGKKAAYEIPVLYGGSVDAKNAAGFLRAKGVNGLLVGGASLVPNEFVGIVRASHGI